MKFKAKLVFVFFAVVIFSFHANVLLASNDCITEVRKSREMEGSMLSAPEMEFAKAVCEIVQIAVALYELSHGLDEVDFVEYQTSWCD